MRPHLSIRNYLILMNLLLLCLLLPTISLLFMTKTASFRDEQLAQTISQMENSLKKRSASLVRALSLSAAQAISGYEISFLLDLANEVVINDPEIIYCIVMDMKQNAVAHSDPRKVGVFLNAPHDTQAATNLRSDFPLNLNNKQTIPVRFNTFTMQHDGSSEQVLETIAPVYNGAVLWGVIRFGYSLTPLTADIKRARADWSVQMKQLKLFFLTNLGIFLSVGIIIAAFFTRSFVRSTRILTDGVNRVAAGDLNYEITKKQLTFKEFVSLANSFNTMTERLLWSRQRLDEHNYSLEAKVAERTKELREAQDIMLKQAHEAGMAEIVVGVLHNIGNAITPAKVTGTTLLKQLSNSPLRVNLAEALRPILMAIEKNPDFSSAEKKRLTKIIALLPESIKEEYDHSISEIENIRIMHEHIENIISLQMRYSLLMGDPEIININLVIQDALKMLNDAILKRGITLKTSYTETPFVKVEEAKLLQILVNLIKNAYEALEISERSDKSLIITTSLTKSPSPFVEVSIKDNGCGFPQEEEKQFFKYGYTTKERGSGFGLHSCANYLIANNGSIEARSEGPGLGAEFIIKLPAVDPKNNNSVM